MRRVSLPLLLLAAIVAVTAACSPTEDNARCLPGSERYCVPLAEGSPWPKFRRNAAQDGASFVTPSLEGGELWVFETGKGIFSTPVIGADGTIYIGSADRTFYALNPDGTELWSYQTAEIIDSSALLDDLGRVYFGSGDGTLYALDAATGEEVWTFEADSPESTGAFINWFEGNVAILPDGRLVVPNDNFSVYTIDRETGLEEWHFNVADQTWSLPAVDPEAERFYIGNNNLVDLLGDNTFAVSFDGGTEWSAFASGTVAASPMLSPDGRTVYVGGFDGILRAYDAETGEERWTFGTRDHIYASPGWAPDGLVIQPSADGTVYALEPESGEVVWAFDTREPVRSSPAIDAEGNVYLGSGEGRLFVLNPDGTLRWALRLIDDGRNDLNASAALGREAIYIAGESGEIFSVPYDYCLRDEAADDDRCAVGPEEDLPEEGAFLYFTNPFGGAELEPPATIDPNQMLAFSLFVRESGDTALTAIDSDSVSVSVDPAVDLSVRVSGDRRFVTVIAPDGFDADDQGRVTISVAGEYLVDLDREGLAFSGGTTGGSFDETFDFSLASDGPDALPLPVPAAPGDESGALEIRRLSAPMPTILPSYNQIGFDQLQYLVGMVEGDGHRAVGWLVGGTLAEGDDRTIVDPATLATFPLEISFERGVVTMTNEAGLSLNVMNADLAFESFRVAARLDEEGNHVGTPQVHVETVCSDIDFYGAFLQRLGFCNPQTDVLSVFGTAIVRQHQVQSAPSGLGEVTFSATTAAVTASVSGSELRVEEHALGILLVDTATSRPVTLDYPFSTTRAPESGPVTEVALAFDREDVPEQVRAYLMVGIYPAAVATLDVPAE